MHVSAPGPCAREGVFLGPLAFLLYSSILSQRDSLGARTQDHCVPLRTTAATCGSRFLMICWYRFGTPFPSILVPTWPQLDPQIWPKIHPKSMQEPSKIHPNLHLVFDRLSNRFLIDFWSIFDPEINKKSIKKRSTNHPNDTTTKKQKSSKIVGFYCTVVPWAMLCYVRKSIKIAPTSIKKRLSNQCSNFDRF